MVIVGLVDGLIIFGMLVTTQTYVVCLVEV